MPSDTGQALCRYAGLRCPSEVGVITWADVNWEKGRLTVLSKKTEHHGGDYAVRVVPIHWALHEILREAFEHPPRGRYVGGSKGRWGWFESSHDLHKDRDTSRLQAVAQAVPEPTGIMRDGLGGEAPCPQVCSMAWALSSDRSRLPQGITRNRKTEWKPIAHRELSRFYRTRPKTCTKGKWGCWDSNPGPTD